MWHRLFHAQFWQIVLKVIVGILISSSEGPVLSGGFLKQGVVWECLDNVQGDTYFCTEDFTPYTAEQRSSAAASRPAAAPSDRTPSAADGTQFMPPGPPMTDAQRAAMLAEMALSSVLPREPQPSVDADYALALQLSQVPLPSD